MDENNWAGGVKQFKAALDADQVECRAVLDGTAPFETGLRDEKTVGVVDDALIEPGNSWAERQSLLEDLSGAIAEEIVRRRQIMNDAYPFQIERGSIAYSKSATGVYEFCLAAARDPSAKADGKPQASAVFEWIARDVLTAHLGTGAKGFRTGAPVYDFEQRGAGPRETFIELENRCGEFRWNPAPEFPEEPSHQHLKDAGLDVVVWKPWMDGRLAQLFALGQCACGKTDITPAKGRELSLVRLAKWLRPVTWATPLRCFLAALHIPNSIRLYELAGEAGLVFDRARICLIAEASPAIMASAEHLDYHELAELYLARAAA